MSNSTVPTPIVPQGLVIKGIKYGMSPLVEKVGGGHVPPPVPHQIAPMSVYNTQSEGVQVSGESVSHLSSVCGKLDKVYKTCSWKPDVLVDSFPWLSRKCCLFTVHRGRGQKI